MEREDRMNLSTVYKELKKCKSYEEIDTLADRLLRNGQNQFVFRDEVYLLMISTLLRHINDSDAKGVKNGKA